MANFKSGTLSVAMACVGVEDDDAGAAVELPLLRSPLIAPPFAHGFSTRAGGVSAAPFDSLNMGARWGDAAANVEENRRRLLRAVGVAGPLHVVRQVHGAAVRACAPGTIRRRSRASRRTR